MCRFHFCLLPCDNRIVQITLKNFQAHAQLKLVLEQGITTITGPTDAGKSAIIRALRWICLNDVAGDAFIRDGAKEAEVVLSIDKHEVIRKRGRGNLYELDGKVFEAFGQDVPSDIAKVLRLSPLNFQQQHDSPFWFCETAGEVSRQLNDIVDLSVIDTALANISQSVNQARTRQAMSEERVASTEREYNELKPQQERVQAFYELKDLNERSDKAAANYNRLEQLVERIRVGRDKASSSEDRANDLDGLLSLNKEGLGVLRKCVLLDNAIGSIEKMRAMSEPPPDFGTVADLHDRWQTATENFLCLSTHIERLVRWTDNNTRLDQAATKAESKFHAMIKGKNCPLCNRPL